MIKKRLVRKLYCDLLEDLLSKESRMRQGVKYICKVKSSESDFIINDVALPINIGIMVIYNKKYKFVGCFSYYTLHPKWN